MAIFKRKAGARVMGIILSACMVIGSVEMPVSASTYSDETVVVSEQTDVNDDAAEADAALEQPEEGTASDVSESDETSEEPSQTSEEETDAEGTEEGAGEVVETAGDVSESDSDPVLVPDSDSYYTIDKSTKIITGYSGLDAGVTELVLPSNVMGIANGLFTGSAITKVDLSKTKIVELPEGVFKNCTSLKQVTFNTSLRQIDKEAFANTAIESFEIPANVKEIGVSALAAGSQLKSVSFLTKSVSVSGIDASNFGTASVFGAFAALESVSFAVGTTAIPAYLFANTGFVSNYAIVIPSTVTSIGTGAFANAENLIAVAFAAGSTIQSIGDYAFSNSGLISADLPDSLVSIGDYAFYKTSLTSVAIPKNVTSVGKAAFAQNSALKNVDVKASKLTVSVGAASTGNGVFSGAAIETITFEDENMTAIPARLFAEANFANGDIVVIAKKIKTIGDDAFANAKGLTSVTFEDGSALTTIGKNAFKNTSITEVTLPSSLTTIGENAFAGTGLTSIVIPKAVSKIGNSAFAISTLREVEIKSNSITTDANANTQATAVFGGTSIESVVFTGTFTKIPARLFAYAGFKLGFSITIPSGVTSIETEAFYNATNLSKVLFQQVPSLVTIGDNAFRASGLGSISLPESLVSIGSNAFYASRLSSIVIPKNVTTIKVGAFANISSLTSVTLNCPGLVPDVKWAESTKTAVFGGASINEVVWGDNVKDITSYLFAKAGFKSGATIAIPSSITLIGISAFDSATNLGTMIFDIPTSVATIGDNAFNSGALNTTTFRVIKDSAAHKWLTAKGYKKITLVNSIKYVLSGGTNSGENPTSFEDSQKGGDIYLYPATKAGYTFEGWYSDSKYANQITGNVAGIYTIPTKSTSLTFYAKWLANTYHVRYEANYPENSDASTQKGSAPAIANATYGKSYKVAANKFSVNKYKFVGWTLNPDGSGTVFVPGNSSKETYKNLTTVNGATVTLYAKWEAKTYTIKYSANIGTVTPTTYTGTVADSTGSYFGKVTIRKNAFKVTGYVFKEWNTSSDGSGLSVDPATVFDYADDDSFENLIHSNGSSITLYAIWVPYSYTLWLEPNNEKAKSGTLTINGSADSGIELTGTGYSLRMYCGDFITLKGDEFVLPGYALSSWNTKADGTGTKYANGDIKNLTNKSGAKIVLYAQWTATTYKITYKMNGGTNDKTNPTTYKYGASLTLKNPAKRTGYSFDGWYKTASFDEDSKITAIKKSTYGNLVLYAKWTPITYNVTLDDSFNPAGCALEDYVNVEYGKKLLDDAALGAAAETLSGKYEAGGYYLASWNTKANGKGKSYKTSELKNISSRMGDYVVLYAIYQPVTYKINYTLDGGTNNRRTAKSYKVTSSNITLKTPTRSGCTFVGWEIVDASVALLYDVSGDSPVSVTTGDVVTKLQIAKGSVGDITVKAIWTQNTYTVVFHANSTIYAENTSDITMNFNYEDELPLASIAETIGVVSGCTYEISHFNTKANGKGTSYNLSKSYKRLTATAGKTIHLYAIWKPIKYGITFVNILTETDENPVVMPASVKITNKNTAYYTTTSGLSLKNAGAAGYTFGGWYLNYDENESGADGLTGRISKIPAGTSGAITLYGKWTENKYSVSFYGNGGTVNRKTAVTIKRYYSDEITPADVVMSRSGYIFKGWSLSEADAKKGTVKYAANSDLKKLVSKNGGSKKLYACWEELKVAKVKNVSVGVDSGTGIPYAKFKSASGTVARYEVQVSPYISMKDSVDTTIYKGDFLSTTKGYRKGYIAMPVASSTYLYIRVREVKIDSNGVENYGEWSTQVRIVNPN